MANEKDNQTGRFIEALIYDTPAYRLSRTADGRIVSELSKGRREAADQSRDLMATQAKLVEGLQRLRTDQDAGVNDPRIIENLQHGQEDLVYEQRVLNAVTSIGFTEVGKRLDDLGDVVQGVKSGVERVDHNISGLRSDLSRQAHAAQGPRKSLTSLPALIRNRDEFIHLLAAYQAGKLNSQGRQELESLIRTKFASVAASNHVRQVLRGVSERVREEGLRRSHILNDPEGVLRPTTRDESFRSLAFVEKIAREYPNQALTDFVLSLYAFVNMYEEARRTPAGKNLLTVLVNNGLTTEEVSFEIKRTTREARTDGSAVDRNFNLMEGLQQGDRMIEQGDKLIEQGEEARKHRVRALVHLDSIVELGRRSLANTGRQRIEQGVKFLKAAETSDDFREALELFKKAIDEDPTLMGGQYGAAVIYEALGEMEEACRKYRTVGKMSELPSVAAAAWQRYASLKERHGDLEEAKKAGAAVEQKKQEAALERAKADLEAKKRVLVEAYLRDPRLSVFRKSFEKKSEKKTSLDRVMKSLMAKNPRNNLTYIDCLKWIELSPEGEISAWISGRNQILVADSGLYSPVSTKVLFGEPTERASQILDSQGKELLTWEEYFEFHRLNLHRKYDLCEDTQDSVSGTALHYREPTWVAKGNTCIPVGCNSQGVVSFQEKTIGVVEGVFSVFASWAKDLDVIYGGTRLPEKSASAALFGVERVKVGQRGVLKIPLLK